MFLLGFVNSTFEARRPTGHLELVGLSLEKQCHPVGSRVEKRLGDRVGDGRLQNGGAMAVSFADGTEAPTSTASEKGSNGAAPIVNPSSFARPRPRPRPSLPADVRMEPLHPLVLRSPDGKQMPVYVLEKDLAEDVDQEWSFWNLDAQDGASRMTTMSQITLASVFADGGVSTRVQHHPLEEDHHRDSNSESESHRAMDTIAEEVGRDGNVAHADEGYVRILQHLERIEGSVKDLKARVDDAKLRIKQSEQEFGALPRDSTQAMVMPSLSPSLSSPMMEKMGRVASPEWHPKRNYANPPVMEERELRYSPPLAESDVQDVLSFRLWEQDSSPPPPPKPKRRPRKSSVWRAFEELDLETALDLVADEYANSKDLKLPLPSSGLRGYRVRNAAPTDNVAATTKPSPPNFDALLNLKTFDLGSRRATPKVDVDVGVEADSSQQPPPEEFTPSPCSFTCGLSPTSLFSDDLEPFQMSVSIEENMFLKNFHDGKSPRSVLSPKADEVSRSDSSEAREESAATSGAYLYNDESSDLESPMSVGITATKLAHRPFPTFTYNVGDEMGETSSSEEDQDELVCEDMSTSVAELEFFQEAAKSSHWEPWLGKDEGAVLDDSDLEFLLSPDLKLTDISTSMIAFSKGKTSQMIRCHDSEKTVHDSPRRPKRWVPYVTGELHGSDDASPARRNASEALPRVGGEKTVPKSRPPKRSVNFAPDLVKEIPYSPGPASEKKPAPPLVNPRAKPNVGVKKWEVEEDGPSIMTSRRWWRKNQEESTVESPGGSSRAGSSFRSGSRRQKVAQAVPCAGKLFSWPQRLSFKVSGSRVQMESDEESIAGDQSFGTSARRDADQVRRILKGSQKRYSNLTVAEIMKEDFSK